MLYELCVDLHVEDCVCVCVCECYKYLVIVWGMWGVFVVPLDSVCCT